VIMDRPGPVVSRWPVAVTSPAGPRTLVDGECSGPAAR
jgi:hypothetical protein